MKPMNRMTQLTVIVSILGALCLTGCGQQKPVPYFLYEHGKINLNRITYITPRIRVGIDEYALDAAEIDRALEKIKADHYSYFRVEAVILFDEFAWTAYRSPEFDKKKHPPSPADLREIRRGLKKALKVYRSI